jgi:DNA-binding CsgD family transcriptional regulator
MTTAIVSAAGWTPVPGDGTRTERPEKSHLIDVYRYAARHGRIDSASFDLVSAELGITMFDVFSAATRLVELHLLRTDDEYGTTLLPMDSQSAASLLIAPIERAIFQQREMADRLRERIEAVAGPQNGAFSQVGAIDQVQGFAEIRGLLKFAAGVCRSEAAVLRPGHAEDTDLDDLFDACYTALDPAVELRVLCPHRDRADFASRAKAKKLADGGAAVRTMKGVPQTAVVFDRTLTVMITVPGDGGEPTARPVRDGSVVRFMMDMFDLQWETATPFSAEDPGYAEGINDELQQSIARLMAQGLTDEVVARRLGMSIRTCRRHIAALLRNLDSVSRFQAGVQAAQRLSAGQPRSAERA